MFEGLRSKQINNVTVATLYEPDRSYLFTFDEDGYSGMFRVRDENGVASAHIDDAVWYDKEPEPDPHINISKRLDNYRGEFIWWRHLLGRLFPNSEISDEISDYGHRYYLNVKAETETGYYRFNLLMIDNGRKAPAETLIFTIVNHLKTIKMGIIVDCKILRD